jgi:hypothetical protein
MTTKLESAQPADSTAIRRSDFDRPAAAHQGLGVVDLVASVAITLISASFAAYLIAQSGSFRPFGPLLVLLSVVSWLAATALVVVFRVRGRLSFYWPVVGIAAMFGCFALLVALSTGGTR